MLIPIVIIMAIIILVVAMLLIIFLTFSTHRETINGLLQTIFKLQGNIQSLENDIETIKDKKDEYAPNIQYLKGLSETLLENIDKDKGKDKDKHTSKGLSEDIDKK